MDSIIKYFHWEVVLVFKVSIKFLIKKLFEVKGRD